MRIAELRIQNFRAFKDETIYFDDYTSFIGPNGAGKSTIFYALNIFFRQNKDSQTDLLRLSKSDFHHSDTSKEIRITVTFSDLSEKAKEDLADYVRQEKLVVSAVAKYDEDTNKAEIKQYGNRLGIEKFKAFFEADKQGSKVSDLKVLFKELKDDHPDIREANTKGDMIAALHAFESNNPTLCSLIPSEDQFYGVSRGVNRLESHIQWIFIPAIKDVTEESQESSKSALGQLLARTVRSKVSFDEKVKDLRDTVRTQYQRLLDEEQKTLDEISESLQRRLMNWSHPNITASVQWKQDPDRSIKIEEPLAGLNVGERGFIGELSRFGHGLQRSYMLALLQELSTFEAENIPTLVMGIEEPELFQHPPQARYLAETLFELSQSSSQIMICTHNPLFIPGDGFDKIRLAQEVGKPSQTKISQLSYDELSKELSKVGEKLVTETGMIAKLYPSLNPLINEMFFCKKLILVEGQEDLAYISTYLCLTGNMIELRRNGGHIVPVEGKSKLIKPLAMANLLGIPTMVIYDSDTNKDEIQDETRRNSEVTRHKKDNKAILLLKKYDGENEWPKEHLIKEDLTAWKTNLTMELYQELGQDFQTCENEAAVFYGNAGGLKKNPLGIAKTLEISWNKGIKSNLLLDLTARITNFLNAN